MPEVYRVIVSDDTVGTWFYAIGSEIGLIGSLGASLQVSVQVSL